MLLKSATKTAPIDEQKKLIRKEVVSTLQAMERNGAFASQDISLPPIQLRKKSIIEDAFGDELTDMLKASERLLSIQKNPKSRKQNVDLKYTLPSLGLVASIGGRRQVNSLSEREVPVFNDKAELKFNLN